MSKNNKNAIAVVGMSALFADARNYREFWNNILTNKTCIREVDESRWSIKDFYDPQDKTGDKTYSKVLGKIPEVDIDLVKLGIPPTSVEVIETSQLLGVQLGEEALIDAQLIGENAKNFDREKAGVIVAYNGIGSLTENWWSRAQAPKLKNILINSGLSIAASDAIIEKTLKTYLSWQEASFPGYLPNVVSGRIANRLDLNGLNYIVGAACASALTAVRAAIHELNDYSCDTMLVGAVCIDSILLISLSFSNTQALSEKEYCAPFDKHADGMLLGEGIGFVVLKRLEDAIAAQDRIYGVLRGTGAASDGKGKSIYAPAEKGQILALKTAYQSADVEPSTITMIEAHGTGTKVGDEVELSSLNQFFSHVNASHEIALGSVKSQIGHTRTSAGMASLIKVMLSLYYKTLPLTANISEPNAAISKPFYLNTTNRPWFSFKDYPRRAGINSFGFGGTNFHAIVEEYQDSAKRLEWDINFTPALFLFSADSFSEMLERCRAIETVIKDSNGMSYYKQLCELFNEDVKKSIRLSIVAKNFQHFISCLTHIIVHLEKGDTQIQQENYFLIQQENNEMPKVVLAFPKVDELRLYAAGDILLRFPELQSLFTEKEAAILYPPPVFSDNEVKIQQDNLRQLENAQHCITVLHKLYAFLLEKAEINVDQIVQYENNAEFSHVQWIPLHSQTTSYYEDFLRGLAVLWQKGVFVNPAYFQPNSIHSTMLQDKPKKFTIKVSGGRYMSESTASKIEAALVKEELISRGNGDEWFSVRHSQ